MVLGAVTAVFNVLVIGHVFGFNPTVELAAAINIAFGAIITLVANSDSTKINAQGTGKP
jgi:hypothetical protein